MNRTALIGSCLPLSLSLPVSLAAGSGAPGTAVVIKSVADMHRTSNDTVELVSQAVLGTNVKIARLGEERRRGMVPDRDAGHLSGVDDRNVAARPARRREALRLGRPRLRGHEPLRQHLRRPRTSRSASRSSSPPSAPGSRPGPAGAVVRGHAPLRDEGLGSRRATGRSGTPPAPRKKLSPEETVALAKRFLGVTLPLGRQHGLRHRLFRLRPAPLSPERDRHPPGRRASR